MHLRVPLAVSLSLLLLPLAAAGQSSYQTEKLLRAHSGLLNGAPEQPKSPGSAAPPRFRGWKRAQKDGPEALAHFARPRSLASAASRVNNSSPLRVPTNVVYLAPLTPPPTPFPFPGLGVRPSLPAGRLPSAIVVGDFNGDGKLDWVIANGGDNSLYIYLGNGDGTSQLPVILPTAGRSPIALAAADLNGDGKLDLVVVEADSQTIGILLGKGDGTFGSEIELRLPVIPLAVAIADINKDGKPDLVVGVSALQTAGPFVTLLGDGTGGFGSPIATLNGNGLIDQTAESLSVMDVNGDGILDVLATGSDTAGGTSQIYIGLGNGSFAAGEILERGAAMGGFYVDSGILADVTGDGCPDGLVGDNASVVHVYPGDCKGHFDNTTNYQIYGMGDAVFGIAVADLNGDGRPDLITGGFPFQPGLGSGTMAGNLVGVRLNDGTGHFGPLKVYAGDPGMFSLAVADLKGNGRPEILTANQDADSASVYQNDGSGAFGRPSGGYTGMLDGTGKSTANPADTEFVLSDVNGDGLPDIFQIQIPPGGFQFGVPVIAAVLLNQGNGNFSAAVHTNLFNSFDLIGDFILADFRNTGRPDLLASLSDASNNSQPVFAFAPNTGNGQFGAVSFIPVPAQNFGTVISGIGVGDFNHDGKLDFVVIAESSSQSNSFQVLMYLGNGDGTFRQLSQTLAGVPVNSSLNNPISPAPVVVEDANKDGKLDLLVWLPLNGEFVEFLGNGDGTFQAPTTILNNVQEMTFADLNHDGLLDIVQVDGGAYAANQPSTITIYLGKPDGSFSSPTTYTAYLGNQAEFFTSRFDSSATGLFGQLVGDFNNDGNLDIAVFQTQFLTSRRYVQFLIGKGDGSFAPTSDIFMLGERDIPVLATRNLLGDGNTAFLHEGDFGATYHIIPTAPGPSFQVEMAEKPVLNLKDALHIQLNTTSTSDKAFQLSVSDPAIQIPAGITIPAGQTSIDVPFSIGAGFNVQKVFSIAVQSGTETEVTYNFASSPNLPSGFQSSIVASNAGSIAPGSNDPMGVFVASQGDATATFQVVGCLDLPSTATCDIPQTSFFVPPGVQTGAGFTIRTDPGIPLGSYPFRLQITDGVETFFPSGTLTVGDFTLTISPSILAVPSFGPANFTYKLGSLFNYRNNVTLTCSNLPTGAACGPVSDFAGLSGTLPITLNQVPPGNYTFTVTGTSDTLKHSVTAQLQLLATPTAVLSQSQLSLPLTLVGATSTGQITLQNSGSGPLNIQNITTVSNPGSSGTFSQTNTCGTTLAINSMCSLNLTFTAASVGSASGSMQLTDDAAASPQTVPLSASGEDFSITAANGSATSQTIAAGQTATYNLQIQPTQFQGTIVLTCSGAPGEASCSSTLSQAWIASSSPVAFQVQVFTIARSSSLPRSWRFNFKNRQPAPFLIFIVGFVALFEALILFKRLRWRWPISAATTLVCTLLLASCGGGSNAAGGGTARVGTQAGTYTLVVTGQGGGGTRTLSLQLTVQ